MIKKVIKRITRTGSDVLYMVAPVWHLTNLRREAIDQLEDLHYQVGLCQANRSEIEERIQEIDYLLKDPDIDKNEAFTLEGEKRQLQSRLEQTNQMETQAEEVRESYEESLPRIVSDLDMAIQMSRQAKAQKSMSKLLTGGAGAANSDVQEHIKKVRAQAYAVNAQVRGHLMSSKSRKKGKLLPK
jgi:uncharacterized coiled-coil DUF342 family protein